MSKDFTGQLKTEVQSDPADLLLSHSERIETPNQVDTAEMIKKAFKIVDIFKELDPTSRTIVLEKLREINHLDQTSIPEDELTVEQAAVFLGVSDRTIRNYLKNGKLQGIKKGKRWIFSKKILIALEKNRKT